MTYPRNRERAPESELERYLQDARSVLAGTIPAPPGSVHDRVSADFEHLRWFDLPPACLADAPGPPVAG